MKTVNRFMVVDDDPLNNMVCKYIILKYDKEAEITLFTDPEKALESIHDTFSGAMEKIDTVIFLDINMPVINGWEFLEAFEKMDEKIHQQITIYILSSSIDQGDIEKADKNPFVKGYFPKPLSIETMQMCTQE